MAYSRLSLRGLLKTRVTPFSLYAGLLPCWARRRRRLVIGLLPTARPRTARDHTAATAQQLAWQK
jgi:hypothetical protein